MLLSKRMNANLYGKTFFGSCSVVLKLENTMESGGVQATVFYLTSLTNSNMCQIMILIQKSNQCYTVNLNPEQKLNIDQKLLNQWLLDNKISLHATKTEL